MSRKKKPINLPGALVELFEDKEEAQIEIAQAAVMDLVRRGKISPYQGAEILGMRYEDFSVLTAGEELPVIDYG